MKYEELSEESKENAINSIIDYYAFSYIPSEAQHIALTTIEEWSLPDKAFKHHVDYDDAIFWCVGPLEIYYKDKWEQELQNRGWLKTVVRSIVGNCTFEVIREGDYSYIECTSYHEPISEEETETFTEVLNEIYAEIVDNVKKELRDMYNYHISKDFAFEMLARYDLEFTEDGEHYID